MHKLSITIALSLLFYPAFTQTGNPISLEDCYAEAFSHHPLQERPALIEQSKELRLAQIEADKLPNIDWKGQASYQSETVSFPFEIPGTPSIDLPLFRAQTSLNAQYKIYDGGMADSRKLIEEAAAQSSRQEVAVELDKLKEQVNQSYFAILMLRKKKEILHNSTENLQVKILQLEAALEHGVILESEVDKLKVEILRLQATIAETEATIRGAIDVLNQLTEMNIDENTMLEAPEAPPINSDLTIEREELRLFDLKKEEILANGSMITARRKPKVSTFLQAGVGYPNPLNFFDDSVSPFALGGVQFSWPITDWKKGDRDRQILAVQSQIVDNQKAIFLRNIKTVEGRFFEDINAIEVQLAMDRQIQELQQKILEQLSSQLDNGVITSAEYIDQVNAERQANLTLETHQLQLLQTRIEYLTHMGRMKD